jgi:hypothetical protein
MKAGLIIISEFMPSNAELLYESMTLVSKYQSFRVRAVWPDQDALPNRAFALRLRLECF